MPAKSRRAKLNLTSDEINKLEKLLILGQKA